MATPLPEITRDFDLHEVARWTGGRLTGEAGQVRGLGTDTRALPPGALFVALRGERYDAHDHLGEAVARGAGALLVRRGTAVPAGVPTIEVEDTLYALGEIARGHVGGVISRQPLLGTLAITGSAGKTTTREIVTAGMEALHGPGLSNRGNLNNLVGVPLTLLGLEARHRWAVVECGTSAPGEIARLGEIVAPTVAVVLNADAGHTQGLGSIEGVAREKGALFAAATRAVVANADDPPSRAQLTRSRAGEVWLFGEGPDAHVRVAGREVCADGRVRVRLALDPRCEAGAEFTVETRLLGRANALDLAAAVCALAAAGARGRALHSTAAAIGRVPAVAGRLRLEHVGTLRVLDDTYNANPRSVGAALEAAGELARALGARLVVALGDMRELGDLSAAEHRRVGARVRESGAAVFVAAGPEMARAAATAEGAGVLVRRAVDAAEAGAALRALVAPGDVVLVKGSRGMAMEAGLAALREGA